MWPETFSWKNDYGEAVENVRIGKRTDEASLCSTREETTPVLLINVVCDKRDTDQGLTSFGLVSKVFYLKLRPLGNFRVL